MTTARQDRHRKTRIGEMNQAVSPVIEHLEARQLLSASLIRDPRSHMVVGVQNTPAQAPAVFATLPKSATSSTVQYPAGGIHDSGKAPKGIAPDQIRHLYGLDQLDTENPNYPLYLNRGDKQTIVVVGAAASFVNDVPMGRKSNLNIFSDTYGLFNTPVFTDTSLLGGGGGGGGPGSGSTLGAVESMMELEWAHAMAPYANLLFVEVPSTGGVVAPADLMAGIQIGIDDLQLTGANAFDNTQPGGVIVTSLATVGEDPTVAAQYDTLLSQASAANVSVIAPVGDYGGTISSPASSPFVTAIGGTLYRLDATGNRIYETASLTAGGGQSTAEALPAFQQGIKAGKTTLTSRGVPDLSLISDTRGAGVNIYYDPKLTNDSQIQWYLEEGTSVGAPIFAGMVADANELRMNVGLGPIGQQLNATLYQGFKQYPKTLYNDITQGNNILYKATKGYDLATGMGTPKANTLIPFLAGIVNTTANVTFNGSFTTSLNVSPGVQAHFRAKGTASVGSQYINLNLPLYEVFGTSTTAANTAVFSSSAINRNPDNTFNGTGQVVVTYRTTSGVTTTTRTKTLSVVINGKVGGRASSPKLTGQITSVDPNTGRPLNNGIDDIFQGSFRT